MVIKKDVLQIIVVILIIVGAGMFAVNQTLGYIYKSQFLQTPCQLCLELNPDMTLQKSYKVNLTGELVLPKPYIK